MIIEPHQFLTHSLRISPWGKAICNILAAAIDGADARNAVHKHVLRKKNHLIFDDNIINMDIYKRVFIIGAGKASVTMALSMNELLGDSITSGLIITKEGYIDSNKLIHTDKIRIIEAGHPIPDQRNINAGKQILTLTKDMQNDDLVIILLSGGGSSLLTSPAPELSLKDIQVTTSQLLSCGATIQEMNTVRKHLDQIKGGGLATLLFPATVITIILSDVIGDDLDTIASGPTVGDHTTYQDAWNVLDNYQLIDKLPHSIRSHISTGIMGLIPDTVKPGAPILDKVTNIIAGRNQDALTSAVDSAIRWGFTPQILSTVLQGEASTMGKFIAKKAKTLLSNTSEVSRPACLITGGETIVTLRGNGIGGRNQELALGAVKTISGTDKLILISLATDGGDGPTDAAGAVVTNETWSIGLRMGLDPQTYLQRNDSFHYFEALGDLIKTGPTLTNVNDLLFVFGF